MEKGIWIDADVIGDQFGMADKSDLIRRAENRARIDAIHRAEELRYKLMEPIRLEAAQRAIQTRRERR